MAKKPFSIDDAFDENLDDVVVRVYGSTTVEKSAFSARNSGVKPAPSEGIARKWRRVYLISQKVYASQNARKFLLSASTVTNLFTSFVSISVPKCFFKNCL